MILIVLFFRELHIFILILRTQFYEFLEGNLHLDVLLNKFIDFLKLIIDSQRISIL